MGGQRAADVTCRTPGVDAGAGVGARSFPHFFFFSSSFLPAQQGLGAGLGA